MCRAQSVYRVTGLLLSLLSALAVITATARAEDDATWPVEGKLVGKKGHKAKDVSGIACSTAYGFPRSCLVIDDESQHAQLVTLDDGKLIAGDTVPLIDDEYDDKPLELDGEGVAYADGFYYVIGSHGYPRDRKQKLDPVEDAALIKARIAASSQIIRIGVLPGGGVSEVERSAKLKEVIRSEPELQPFVDQRLENNGITIEGIAVRRGRVYAGFRGPTLNDGGAVVLSAALTGLFGSEAADSRSYLLPLGGRGVRDLAAFDDGILILAGPTADGAGSYAIYAWDGEGNSVRLLRELSDVIGADSERKPESLLVLDKSDLTLRALILFDGENEGAPIAVTMPAP